MKNRKTINEEIKKLKVKRCEDLKQKVKGLETIDDKTAFELEACKYIGS